MVSDRYDYSFRSPPNPLFSSTVLNEDVHDGSERKNKSADDPTTCGSSAQITV
jgi:hypothetical protein